MRERPVAKNSDNHRTFTTDTFMSPARIGARNSNTRAAVDRAVNRSLLELAKQIAMENIHWLTNVKVLLVCRQLAAIWY
jgi:hypothetical protein